MLNCKRQEALSAKICGGCINIMDFTLLSEWLHRWQLNEKNKKRTKFTCCECQTLLQSSGDKDLFTATSQVYTKLRMVRGEDEERNAKKRKHDFLNHAVRILAGRALVLCSCHYFFLTSITQCGTCILQPC